MSILQTLFEIYTIFLFLRPVNDFAVFIVSKYKTEVKIENTTLGLPYYNQVTIACTLKICQ